MAKYIETIEFWKEHDMAKNDSLPRFAANPAVIARMTGLLVLALIILGILVFYVGHVSQEHEMRLMNKWW